jgi:deazaflavin-dependent oxidoreductase (nitroreductase family)
VVDLASRPPPTPFSERTGLLGVRVMESINVSLFRLSAGHVGGTIFGEPVILLTTTGRKSGKRYTKPLLALRGRSGSWFVVGSRGGTSGHPDWYLNLCAYIADPGPLLAPVVESRDGTPVAVVPKNLTGATRQKWWDRFVAVYPKFDAYQRRAPNRLIPVIRLTPKH